MRSGRPESGIALNRHRLMLSSGRRDQPGDRPPKRSKRYREHSGSHRTDTAATDHRGCGSEANTARTVEIVGTEGSVPCPKHLELQRVNFAEPDAPNPRVQLKARPMTTCTGLRV